MRDSHEVMAVFVVEIPSKCCSRDFSADSYI